MPVSNHWRKLNTKRQVLKRLSKFSHNFCDTFAKFKCSYHCTHTGMHSARTRTHAHAHAHAHTHVYQPFVRDYPDLPIAQLMPLPLTVSCSSKIQIGFTFLVPAHPGRPGQRAVKRVCVCNPSSGRRSATPHRNRLCNRSPIDHLDVSAIDFLIAFYFPGWVS